MVASGESRTYSSTDGGGGWRPLTDEPGLLAWTGAGALFRVGFDGMVSRSGDGGRTWDLLGKAGGRPAAFDNSGEELYIALHDGTVKRSADAGRSWQLRSRP